MPKGTGSKHRIDDVYDDVDEKDLLNEREERLAEIATVGPGIDPLQQHEFDEKTDEPHSLEATRRGRAKKRITVALGFFTLFVAFPWDLPGVSWLVSHSTVLRYVQETLHPRKLCCCSREFGRLNNSSPTPNATCMLLKLCRLTHLSLNGNSDTLHLSAASTWLYSTFGMGQRPDGSHV